MNKRIIKNLIISLVIVSTMFVVTTTRVYACESNYGGGDPECPVVNKSFRIEKKVRIEGDSAWKGKVTDVKEGDIVEFRIRVENVGEVEVDSMKYEDFLPEEMVRVGGFGLTEYWDNFAPGDVVEFVIEAVVDAEEYDRENFDKCVVNKVELTYDGAFEGSDTATVCYGDAEVTELPKTGVGSTVALAITGLGFVITGSSIRRKNK